MKKLYKLSLLLLMLPMLFGCKETDIIFDIEQPRFETRPGLQLLEVICPYVTASNDQIYIIGPFNGGLDAIGDPRWLLEKAPDTDVSVSKWGIYLNPNDFINGKTLADGYTFYNVAMGEERSLENTRVTHTEAPAPGQRENVFIYLWQDHFNDKVSPDQIPHSGYTIYVLDNTGYNYLSMYGYTDGGQEVFGTWPGLDTTGRISINGLKLKYFDCGYENDGKTVTLIFNNRGKGEQMQPYQLTLDRDYYLDLKATGDIEEFDPSAYVAHDGYAVFVYNSTGWETPYLYMWGDAELFGGWPGRKPTGTQVINNVVYLYYDFGIGATGLNENLIFNDNGAPQLPDFNFTINRDLYVEITAAGVTEIDPETFTPSGTVPDEEEMEARDPIPGEEVAIYVDNHTSWSPLYLYTWKNNGEDLLGAWPGKKSDGYKEINGLSYKVFIVPIDNDTNYFIFNNGTGGDGYQSASYPFVLDKDYYLMLTTNSLIDLNTGSGGNEEGGNNPSLPQYHLYIEDNTGWSQFYVYAYANGADSLFGGWPGAQGTETTTIDGITYYVFTFDADGKNHALIFNNNAGTQYDALSITANQDYYIIANPTNAQIKGQ